MSRLSPVLASIVLLLSSCWLTMPVATPAQAWQDSSSQGRASVKVRLALNRTTVQPGGRLGVRIENLGSQDVAYNLFYYLYRRERESWEPLHVHPVFGPLLNLREGSVSDWQIVGISRHARPGWYRIEKWVEPEPQRHAERTYLSRVFEVAAPPAETGS